MAENIHENAKKNERLICGDTIHRVENVIIKEKLYKAILSFL